MTDDKLKESIEAALGKAETATPKDDTPIELPTIKDILGDIPPWRMNETGRQLFAITNLPCELARIIMRTSTLSAKSRGALVNAMSNWATKADPRVISKLNLAMFDEMQKAETEAQA